MAAHAHGAVKLGTDPEFFFVHNETGEVVPADKLLPSVKEPIPVGQDGEDDGVYKTTATAHFDGIQGEVTIKESFCKRILLDRVQRAVYGVIALANSKNSYVDISSSKSTPKEILNSALPEARIFGCDVDYISWLGGRPNFLRIDPLKHYTRYAGGHIHLGYVDIEDGEYKRYQYLYKQDDSIDRVKELLTSREGAILVVKAMDYLVGNTMVMLDQSPESTLRREIYGKAGVFRNPPHGVEYRVLSNFFLVSPYIMDFVLTLSREAIGQFLNEGLDQLLGAVPPEDIIIAINTNDKELATRNWEAIKGSVAFTEPHLLPTNIKAFEYVASVGMDKVFGDVSRPHWNEDKYTNKLSSKLDGSEEFKQFLTQTR